jgi:hypothetical protein
MTTTILTSDQMESLAEGIVRGQYNLLLGAGASMDAQAADGTFLPSANGLKEELIKAFRIPADSSEVSLSTIYEEADFFRTDDGENLTSYLERRFSKCVPARWHRILPTMNWNRIWTLNIDDVLEQTYSTVLDRRQRPVSISWSDPHRDNAPEELQILHLHGKVWGNSPLVFSIVEYLQATSARHAWHRIFGDHFQDQPFLVVGARLMDEYDLAPVIRRGSASGQSRGQPSYVVLKSISELQRQQFRRANLIPIEMGAGTFFEGLSQAVAAAERRVASHIPGRTQSKNVDTRARIFLNQFQWLSLDAPKQTESNFYGGADPTWTDILNQNDATFEVVQTVVQSLNEKTTKQQLELLHGPFGTGKTTALLRIGRELIRKGLDVYLFRSENRPDVEAILWWLNGSPNTLLLFDGLADHAEDLAEVLARGAKTNTTVRILGTERERRIRTILNNIAPEFLQYEGRRKMRVLSPTDIESLLTKLRSRTRLGRITRRSREEQFAHFANGANRQLFVGMSRLESGPGFMHRFRAEVTSGALQLPHKAAVALSAITYYFGYPLPVSIASAAVGLPTPALLDAITTGALQELVVVKPNGLQLRHRHFASMMVEEILSVEEKYEFSQLLAKNLAPHVDFAAIERRSLGHKIVKNLFDHRNVRIWAGGRAGRWYAELEELYGWNARFWEQRALLLVRRGNLAEARSYAEKAVSIHKDVFTLTTLGNVALRQMVASLENGEPALIEDYWAAVDLLREARNDRQTADDHSFSVFFAQSIKVASLLAQRDKLPDDMVTEINDWFSETRRNPTFDYKENAKRLTAFRSRWLQIFTRNKN